MSVPAIIGRRVHVRRQTRRWVCRTMRRDSLRKATAVNVPTVIEPMPGGTAEGSRTACEALLFKGFPRPRHAFPPTLQNPYARTCNVPGWLRRTMAVRQARHWHRWRARPVGVRRVERFTIRSTDWLRRRRSRRHRTRACCYAWPGCATLYRHLPRSAGAASSECPWPCR